MPADRALRTFGVKAESFDPLEIRKASLHLDFGLKVLRSTENAAKGAAVEYQV
jgi:hypothetical protein